MIAELYRPGTSLLHRWDPRAKLVLIPLVLAAFFVPADPWPLLVLTAAVVMLVIVELGPSQIVPPLLTLWPILALMTVLTPPFHRGGAAVLEVARIPVLTREGLAFTAVLELRLIGITTGLYAVLRTLSLDDMVLGLRWFRLPYPACLVMTMTLRTIPTLAATWRNVVDAHRLRRDGTRGKPRLVQTYVPVLTSVLIESVKAIPLLAMALESRGFGRSNPRTSYAGLRQGISLVPDALALVAAIAILFWPVFLPR